MHEIVVSEEHASGFSLLKDLKEPKCYPLPTPKHEWLLAGEDIEIEIQDVIFVKHGLGIAHGSLVGTNYQLRFASFDKEAFHNECNFISVPLLGIDRINKIGDLFSSLFTRQQGEHCFCLEIECKDGRLLRFSFVPNTNGRGKILSWLHRNTAPASRIFANQYTEESFFINRLYFAFENPMAEYLRMGFSPNSGPWRVTDANKKYQLCSSYPSQLLVPSCVQNEILFASAKFRTQGRIPVCSWRHPQNGAVLCRSSQPRVGLVGKTCDEDQFLMLAIQEASLASHPNAGMPDPVASICTFDTTGPPPMVIYDPRPRVNAVANTVAGAGYESAAAYRNCQVRFLGIGNIHVMRESFNRWRQFCNSEMTQDMYPVALQATEWHSHLATIFQGANRVAEKIRLGFSALIHCSDGWDRTTQLISCAQLLLDPYYRTFRGFIVLIEKEWLSYGHKFSDRCRTAVTRDIKLQERSPIFLQFLECVFHLVDRFPSLFEFNELLLRELAVHVHSGRFGTFLYNTERERVLMLKRLHGSTTSLWAFIAKQHTRYTNKDFASLAVSQEPLTFDPTSIKEWPFYPSPKIIETTNPMY